jgi:Rrf2 family nitric oxide-sensitive transcriptional repressor
MRLTAFTDYALRTLIYLGLHPERLSTIDDICAAYDVPRNHLTKVVHLLGSSGWVQTVRGKGGGMRLAVPPNQIPLGQVVRLTESDFEMVECFNGATNRCVLSPACRLKSALKQATDAWFAVLDPLTLADVLGNEAGLRRQLQMQPA